MNKAVVFILTLVIIGFLADMTGFTDQKPFFYTKKFDHQSKNIDILIKTNLSIVVNNANTNFLSIKNKLDSIFAHVEKDFKIVIDPGHGGVDPGTVQGDLYEKDLNLIVAKKLKKYLKNQGFQVVMTREKDETLTQKQRVSIAKAEKPDIFISIHANSSWDKSLQGVEIYWNTFQSKHLAQRIERSFIDMTNSNIMTVRSRYYVLRNTNFPAILVEIGYISNEYERYELLKRRKQNGIVEAITGGILQYYNSKKSTANS